VYKLSDDLTEVNVEACVETATYDEFAASLPKDECRYCVYDFEYESDGGAGTRNKILFYVWLVLAGEGFNAPCTYI
jgi:cofilin